MEYKVDVPRSLLIVLDEIIVAWGSLSFGVARQHGLKAHAYALDVLDRRPAGPIEKIEADDSVRIDMWVEGYWAGGGYAVDKDNFGCLDRITTAEHELQSIHIVLIDGIFIHDPYIHKPFVQVIGANQFNAWRELLVELRELLLESLCRKHCSQ